MLMYCFLDILAEYRLWFSFSVYTECSNHFLFQLAHSLKSQD